MPTTLSANILGSLASTTIELTGAAGNGDNLLCIQLNTVPEESEEVHEARAAQVRNADTITLSGGIGVMQWQGVSCPLAAGPVEIDRYTLSANIPASLASTTSKLAGAASNGDNLLYIQLNTVPEEGEEVHEASAGEDPSTDEDAAAEVAGFAEQSVTALSILRQAKRDFRWAKAQGRKQILEPLGCDVWAEVVSGEQSAISGLVQAPGSVESAAGQAELDVEQLAVQSIIPASLASTTIKLTGAASNGDNLLCIQLNTVPEEGEEVHEALAARIRSNATRKAVCSGRGKGSMEPPKAEVLERQLRQLLGQVRQLGECELCERLDLLNAARQCALTTQPLVFASGSSLLAALLAEVFACLQEA